MIRRVILLIRASQQMFWIIHLKDHDRVGSIRMVEKYVDLCGSRRRTVPVFPGQDTSVVKSAQSTQYSCFTYTMGALDDRESSRESKIGKVESYAFRIAWKCSSLGFSLP